MTKKSKLLCGPFFKFQIWQDGRNQTRRVRADEAQILREDIDNFHRFEQLCGQFAQLNIQQTSDLRALPAACIKPVVSLDAGFASQQNLTRLRELGYSYLINLTRGSRQNYAAEFCRQRLRAAT